MAAFVPMMHCDRFFTNLTCLKKPILDAISQCKKSPPTLISPQLLEGAFAIISLMPHKDLFDEFIQRTHSHWTVIGVSKEVGPILNVVLGGFQELGSDRIAEILRVVNEKEVDVEVQQKLLVLGKSLVKIALRHLNDNPRIATSLSIDVAKMAKLYNLDLTVAAVVAPR